jgi:hypothetical protein
MFRNYLKNAIKPPRRQERQVFLDINVLFLWRLGDLAVQDYLF